MSDEKKGSDQAAGERGADVAAIADKRHNRTMTKVLDVLAQEGVLTKSGVDLEAAVATLGVSLATLAVMSQVTEQEWMQLMHAVYNRVAVMTPESEPRPGGGPAQGGKPTIIVGGKG